MKTNLTNKNRGFTIIEVMIVLAIAGLIMAVVLLAVPALQRTQRNNARRNDATHLAGLVSDYVSNHGGTLPNTSPFTTTGESFSQLQNNTLGTFAATVTNNVSGTTTGVTGASTTNAVIVTGGSCNSSTNNIGSQTGSFAIAWYAEAPGANQLVCIPS